MIDQAFQAFGAAGGSDILLLIFVAIVIHSVVSILADRFFPDVL